MGSLNHFEPEVIDEKIVAPPIEAIEEGICKWLPSLVGQFLDKSLPFFLVKKTVDNLWRHYGTVDVLLMENGMFIFRFADESICDEVLTAKLWHISNKPLILRRWELGMQLLKFSPDSIPIWIKLLHPPLEFWNDTCLSYIAIGVGRILFMLILLRQISSRVVLLGFW